MSQSIQSFYRTAQVRNFSRDYQLKVIDFRTGKLQDADLCYIRTTSLPGRKIESHAVPYAGLNFNLPGTASYPGSDSWTVKFLVDQRFIARKRLEKAQRDTFDDKTTKGKMALPGPNSVITLALHNDNGNVVNKYNLYGCFIKEIGNIEYDLSGSGKPVECTVTLAYQYWNDGVSGGLLETIGGIAQKVAGVGAVLGIEPLEKVGNAGADAADGLGGLLGTLGSVF